MFHFLNVIEKSKSYVEEWLENHTFTNCENFDIDDVYADISISSPLVDYVGIKSKCLF
jgi:hypothetical protein